MQYARHEVCHWWDRRYQGVCAWKREWAMKWDDNANVILIFIYLFFLVSSIMPPCLPACPSDERRTEKWREISKFYAFAKHADTHTHTLTQFAATHRFDLIWYHADIVHGVHRVPKQAVGNWGNFRCCYWARKRWLRRRWRRRWRWYERSNAPMHTYR